MDSQFYQKLVQENYHLYVTTTTPEGAELRAERRKAEQLSQRCEGSITLLEPQYDKELESPTSEWISKSYEQYFGYLIKFEDVKVVIGTLPGTAKTSIELKEILNCKLMFLATSKIEGLDNTDELKEELIRIAEETNEIWCFGPSVHEKYHDLLQELQFSSNVRCQNMMIQPSTRGNYYCQGNASKPRALTLKFLSVWNNSYPFYYMGRRAYSTGSCLQNFCTLSSALGQINARGTHRNRVQWNIYGLKFHDMRTIEKYTEPNTIRLSALSAASSVERLTWQGCQAFLDSDIYAESINYLALNTLWLGVPTIVSEKISHWEISSTNTLC